MFSVYTKNGDSHLRKITLYRINIVVYGYIDTINSAKNINLIRYLRIKYNGHAWLESLCII